MYLSTGRTLAISTPPPVDQHGRKSTDLERRIISTPFTSGPRAFVFFPYLEFPPFPAIAAVCGRWRASIRRSQVGYGTKEQCQWTSESFARQLKRARLR
jgi:hypothetical protein